MGLLTKEVEVNLAGVNVKHFESLGYTIPRIKNKYGEMVCPQNTKLKVKTEDLKLGSTCKVTVQCDECSKIYDMKYNFYVKHNHNGKIYCRHCKSKVLCSGANAWNYNPNRSDEERIRRSSDYINFTKAVLARDEYTCQCCKKKSCADLEVHHLYGFAEFPQYRIDQTQAISLCKNCHSAFHNWHGLNYGYANKGKCTREQYEEWYGKTLNELKEYNGTLISTRKVYCIDNDTVYDSAEIAKNALNIYSRSQIYKVCNHKQHTTCGLHFLWYDEYLTMSEQEIKDYVYFCDNPISYRKVICLETAEVFKQVSEACLKYGDKKQVPSLIRACKNHTALMKDENNNPLHWMYYDDFLALPQEEQNKILERNDKN